MKRTKQITIRTLMTLLIFSVGVAAADDLKIDWYTVDGGGVMRSSGGDYELSGTIGQPDAGVTAGEPYTLRGGFWAVPPCWCVSDLNIDGLRNGADIRQFIGCMLGSTSACACADIDGSGVLNATDLSMFVDSLVAGGACP